MAKDRMINFAVSDEEYKLIMTRVAKRSIEEGSRVNLSKYMRDLIKADLNGSKNVSQAAIDTDSKQKNNPDNSKPPENVSDPPDDTSKSPWKVFNMDDMYDDQ
jgi:hypothetical protein